ncbi:MAG: hypothetical protein ABI699_17405 [Caldimonas sp.]
MPTELDFDTRGIDDGPHRLIVRAQDQTGREGVEEIRFRVHNGPGIIVSGLDPHTTRHDAAACGSGLGLGAVPFRRCLGGLVRRAHVGRARGIRGDTHFRSQPGVPAK